MKRSSLGLLFLLCMTPPFLASAAESPAVEIPHSPEALKRGAETIANVCMACHSLKFIQYGDLSQLGFTTKEIDTLRNGKSVKPRGTAPARARRL